MRRALVFLTVESFVCQTRVETIRESGIAFDREEHTTGICAAGFAVAVPFGGYAAVTVPMPSQRFAGREKQICAALRAVAAEVGTVVTAR